MPMLVEPAVPEDAYKYHYEEEQHHACGFAPLARPLVPYVEQVHGHAVSYGDAQVR
jgi:hypothetical protein